MRLFIALLMNVLVSGVAFAACEGREITGDVHNAPVCIPSEPKRIVLLDPLFSAGMMQELGAPIAAVALLGIQDNDLRAAVQKSGAEDLGNPLEPSLERIVALKPDLIVGAYHLPLPIHEKIASVAPTVLITTTDWKEHFKVLAEIVGKEKEAAELLRGYEERLAGIKARVPDVPVSMVRIAQGRFQVYLDGPAAYAPYAVLHEAGVKRPPYETTTDSETVKRPTWEELSALEGQILLYVVVSGLDSGPDDDLEKETAANPLWQMLPAVKAGRAYRVGRPTWMGFHGIGSAHKVLDDVERYIIDKP